MHDVGSAMIYSSVELLKATDNFSDEREIGRGRGGFGIVYRANIRLCDVAVKKLTEVSELRLHFCLCIHIK